jgi:uncharacterized protein YecE (DUF72 family)
MPIIGTAGWSIPRAVADRFPAEGSGLSRYVAVFNGVEINSTFYRRHKPSTFARWADSVPTDFRFAVKLPKTITHDLRLQEAEEATRTLLDDIAPLGQRLGPLLCQLPPGLTFEAETAKNYLTFLRSAHPGEIVVEPRHPSWTGEEATTLFQQLTINRVFADPAPIDPPATAAQGYMRLHGKPKVYYSSYSDAEIGEFATMLAPAGWCIFDNTASGAAIANALTMRDLSAAV